MQVMTIVEIIIKALGVLLDLWINRTDRDRAQTIAAARLTKEYNNDISSFDKALKENDAATISTHFELLRRRVSEKVTRHGGNTGG